MDPEYNLQDVIRCHLCETPDPPIHCDGCNKYLCKACEGEHLSDISTEHKMVPFNKRRSTPKCLKHSSKICEQYCKQCDISICATCISSKEHNSHTVIEILKHTESKKEKIEKDSTNQEKSTCIYSRDEEFVPDKKTHLENKNPGKLSTGLETGKHVSTADSLGAESSTLEKPPIDVPVIITSFKTDYAEHTLHCVACQSDQELWTCGNDVFMRLYNHHGEPVKSVQTKSGKFPYDIAVTRSGDLVYTDDKDRTVNIVKNTQIETVIRLREWKPRGVCSTSSGDLLVVMDSKSKQTKVVRYDGPTVKESFQYDDNGRPLYSSGGFRYISENRNLDICVSDYNAGAVVVVNKAGDFRFTYTGPTFTTRGSFCPFGITTDSQSRILTTDGNNDRIHIIDQDGQILRYIDNCQLEHPQGLCVDTKDNLFVAEFMNERSKVKKIQYT